MTRNQALKQAVKRWGKTAAIEGPENCYFYGKPEKRTPESHCCAGSHTQPCPGGLPMFKVGRIVMGMFFEITADGKTWKDAFERADAIAKQDAERYAQARKS